MPHKLKSSARRAHRNKLLAVKGFLVAIAVVIGTVFAFGQLIPNTNNNNNSNTQSTSSKNNTTSLTEQGNKVRLQTSMGNITIQLRDDKPITSGNFKNLVAQGLYDGTIFHRVSDYLIQGGKITRKVSNITDEIGSNNTNSKGTIAMAKSALPNSATSEFFINVVDNSGRYPEVDTTYPVFGYVIEGMNVVEAISRVQVDDPNSAAPKPVHDVVIIKAEILP